MAFISNGTQILDAGAFQASLGNLVFISEQTASGSASISFTSGIDSTYPIYKFEFINIHGSNDDENLQFNLSTDSGSNYNVTKTSTAFVSAHNEADTTAFIQYETGDDLAQGTGYQNLSFPVGSDNDQSVSAILHLFSPSSTTYVKHFISTCNASEKGDYTGNHFVAGYGDTTSAINAIDFKFSSGNIDDGIIKMYGVVKS